MNTRLPMLVARRPRAGLAWALACCLAAGVAAAGPDPTSSLPKALTDAAGGRFHTGVGTDVGVMDRPEDVALLLRHFDYITPENCLKMDRVQPAEGAFAFDHADRFVAFAESHGLGFVGHCLLWARDENTPAWVFREGDRPASDAVVLDRLRTHVHAVAGRYQGRIAMWDVVNEALADEDDTYLRDSEWSRRFGEAFLVKAFQFAREAAPDALLIYNDYRCGHPAKLEKLVRLVTAVRLQGGPIDAIGLQAHYEYGMIPFEGIERVLATAREHGLKVVFSELDHDVVTRSRWYAEDGAYREQLKDYDPYAEACPPDVLKQQAEEYARLFALILDYADVVERVTFWNLHDGQSWLNGFPWPRHNYPLLFGRDRQPKPAFDAVVETLTGAGP